VPPTLRHLSAIRAGVVVSPQQLHPLLLLHRTAATTTRVRRRRSGTVATAARRSCTASRRRRRQRQVQAQQLHHRLPTTTTRTTTTDTTTTRTIRRRRTSAVDLNVLAVKRRWWTSCHEFYFHACFSSSTLSTGRTISSSVHRERITSNHSIQITGKNVVPVPTYYAAVRLKQRMQPQPYP